MSEHRRRTRRMQSHTWDGESTPSAASEESKAAPEPAQNSFAPEPEEAYAYEDWGEDPANKTDAPAAPEKAEETNEEPPRKDARRENLLLIIVLACALLAAVVFGVLIYLQNSSSDSGTGTAPTAVPYDVTQPFLPGDITDEQMQKIEENGGSFALMDFETGPHGLRIGDSLDTLLSRFPVTSVQSNEDDFVWDETGDNMSYLTYNFLETDYQVIYAERVFYQGGEMIVLPPSGTLSISSDTILVTLTAPLDPYPEGTAENYLAYPHVYCKLTLDPDTSKITRIVLGKSE